MSKPNCRAPPPRHSSSSGSSTNLASCFVATIFLIFIAIILLIVFFTLFKPRDPTLTVNAVQLPAFAAANATMSLSFAEYIAVRNPNRAVFTHYDSTMQLLYMNNQIGFMFVPAGKIDPGRTEHMVARFNVGSFPIVGSGGASAEVAGGAVDGSLGMSLEIESRMEMVGKLRVLGFFNHQVQARLDCRVAIRVSDGSVMGFRC